MQSWKIKLNRQGKKGNVCKCDADKRRYAVNMETEAFVATRRFKTWRPKAFIYYMLDLTMTNYRPQKILLIRVIFFILQAFQKQLFLFFLQLIILNFFFSSSLLLWV